MTCQTATPCSRCRGTIRRGERIVLLRGLWLHPACVYAPAVVRPYVVTGGA